MGLFIRIWLDLKSVTRVTWRQCYLGGLETYVEGHVDMQTAVRTVAQDRTQDPWSREAPKLPIAQTCQP